MALTITPSVFHGGGKAGDFSWMIDRDEYSNAFLIFNDNEKQFLQHENGEAGGCAVGGGNAAIRPYQCKIPPKAGGIPTGDYGIKGGPGYPALDDHVKKTVDQAVATIKSVLDANPQYTEVIYSSNGHGGLGTNIFTPAQDVTDYIIGKINCLAR